MQIHRHIFMLALAVLSVLPEHAFAWGQMGHRIVAQIAYANMRPSTRRHVDRVLGKNGLIYWSNWADEIRSDSIYPESFDWHYQDIDPGCSDSAVVAMLTDYPTVGGNLFRACDSLFVVLTQQPDNEIALRFFIHLVADRFCPVHTAHLDDMGGNKVRMLWFGQPTNLHRVWDSDLIIARGYSYTEYAQYLQDTYAAREYRSIRSMTDADLALRCYHTIESIYRYQQTWDGNTYHYIYRWHETMEWNLYAAGVRLAMLLDALY